jgi:hypothetical protein
VRESVVRHQQQHAGSGRDARQYSREQAHERPEVDQQSEHRHAANARKHVHGYVGRSEVSAAHA